MVVKWWIIQASRKAYARGLGGVSVNARHTRRGLGGGLGGSLGFECVSIQPSRKANARDLSGSLRFRCVSIQPSRKAYAGGLGGGLGGGLLGLLGLMHPYSRRARPTPVVRTSLVKMEDSGKRRGKKEEGGEERKRLPYCLPLKVYYIAPACPHWSLNTSTFIALDRYMQQGALHYYCLSR